MKKTSFLEGVGFLSSGFFISFVMTGVSHPEAELKDPVLVGLFL